jgi:hypothetical protein
VRDIIEDLVLAAERKLAELSGGGPVVPAGSLCR